MPGAVALSDLVTRVRRRADLENTTFVTDSEVEEEVEQSLGALYDLVIGVNGGGFWQQVTEANPTAAGTATYTPLQTVGDQTEAQIYKVLAVEVQWDGEWRKILPYQVGEELTREDLEGWSHYSHIRYRRLLAARTEGPVNTTNFTQIRFIPTPQAVHSYRVRYIPIPGDWSSLGSSYKFQGFSGWDEWVVCDAAAKFLEKGEKFKRADRLLARKAEAEQRIRWAVVTMDAESQGHIRDREAEHEAVDVRRAL